MIDTPVTVLRLANEMMHLDSYMVKVGRNIDKFNKYVKNLIV